MRRFAALAYLAACGSSNAPSDAAPRATWTWSFAGGGCPTLVTTVHISVTQTVPPGGDCPAQTVSLADVTVPCSDGSAALQFAAPYPFHCASPPRVLTLDALTADGGVYAHDSRTGYDESDGHSDLPSGLGLAKLVWTLENGSGSAVPCPMTTPPTYVEPALGGMLLCTNGSGYVPGQLPGTYDIAVMLVEDNNYGIRQQVGAGNATITIVADAITTTPVTITVSQ